MFGHAATYDLFVNIEGCLWSFMHMHISSVASLGTPPILKVEAIIIQREDRLPREFTLFCSKTFAML